MSQLFENRDQYNINLASSVIYEFSYQVYKASYIGEGRRNFCIMVSEHMNSRGKWEKW